MTYTIINNKEYCLSNLTWFCREIFLYGDPYYPTCATNKHLKFQKATHNILTQDSLVQVFIQPIWIPFDEEI